MNRLPFAILILAAFSGLNSAANEPKPSSSYVLAPKCTFTAQDKSFSIKQYYNYNENQPWQIWVVPKQGSAYRLPENDPFGGYDDASEFNLSPDGHWLARTQRTGSGTGILLLYHRDNDQRFVPVGPNSFDGLIYKFYAKHSGLTKEQQLIDHPRSEFYRWQGSNLLIISLSGESTLFQPMWVTEKWLMAYDLKNKCFLLTDELIDKNIGRIYPVVHPTTEPSSSL